jgi:Protein of unknown function (DUF2911)
MAVAFIIISVSSFSQTEVKPPAVDKSPMDISYFPDQFPQQKMLGKVSGQPVCKLLYGRPQKDGRVIFGDLIKYNEVWRLGANENTEIEFYKNVTIGGKSITKGKYAVFCIPTEKEWTFIINKDVDNWGSFKYNSNNDVVRVKVKATKADKEVESLSIYFTKTNSGASMVAVWDTTTASLPISF